ncbi:YegS/Rv2252/BmrU family lipid kinase [Mucilaginibacter gracilis]|uniref:YegS/Rv2252/BmrU family lipid kinase n=1 Tax=Mucilaginibacter gracilis TaxID=423350 RepID=A0A495IXC0_9SPHI|nr:diacylglycerol kinase family protein [Mucilaginibacter gracilis]RKR81232.1 YegS/Rv2252/BmrU family lipid kinase [Mucilaginibacter gracilis]
MKKKALFIINPVSGNKTKDKVPHLINEHLDSEVFDHEIIFSTKETPISQLSKDAAKAFDIIVAVGGDGTVNETASAIAGSNTVLGILPFGSGNGLARFLKIPMDPVSAIKTLNIGRTETIDAGKINNQWFFNMAGMGFDAHISEVFSHGKTRGFRAYFKSSVQEISNYKAQNYRITIDGKDYDREAFMLSFANSSQYGNNAHVSPKASLHDGLIDVCIIKPFPVYRLPEMGLRMLTKTSESSKFVEIIRGRHIKVKRQLAGAVHLDGEPQIMGIDTEIITIPESLNVIVGKDYEVNL